MCPHGPLAGPGPHPRSAGLPLCGGAGLLWWTSQACIALVDRPTQLIIWIFVELAVATPVERRTFVLVVSTVKKSKLSPISFQNIRIVCVQMDKMQKTGQNSGKKC